MARCENGMALPRRRPPAKAETFMCFTTYAARELRLAALIAGTDRIVMTVTTASGFGRRRSTHQPAKHLAITARTPNHLLCSARPIRETAEAVGKLALRDKIHRPCLSLTLRPAHCPLEHKNKKPDRTGGLCPWPTPIAERQVNPDATWFPRSR